MCICCLKNLFVKFETNQNLRTMKKDHVPAGSDVSAGTYECNNCKTQIKVPSVTSLPPCPKCKHGDWKVISGIGDAKEDPYPNRD